MVVLLHGCYLPCTQQCKMIATGIDVVQLQVVALAERYAIPKPGRGKSVPLCTVLDEVLKV